MLSKKSHNPSSHTLSVTKAKPLYVQTKTLSHAPITFLMEDGIAEEGLVNPYDPYDPYDLPSQTISGLTHSRSAHQMGYSMTANDLLSPPINQSRTRPLSVPTPMMLSPTEINYSNSRTSPLSSSPSTPVRETNIMTVNYDPLTGNKMINSYEIIKELGRGCHGKVKLGKDTRTGELVAIKIVHKNSRRRLGSRSLISTQMAKIQKEIAILKKCSHPHVVQLKEVIDDPTSRKIYMVLEYMDGGEVIFHEKGDDQPILEKPTIRHILRHVIAGLEYLHHQGVIHRDIKPANLLWSSDGAVKISDFGVSFSKRQPSTSFSLSRNHPPSQVSSFDDSSSLSNSPPESMPFGSHTPSLASLRENTTEEDEMELAKTAGSPAFFAPELCWAGDENQPRPKITASIDIWALGVTLYCMAYGRPPFMAESEFDLFELIPVQPLEFPPEASSDPELEDLLRRLLEKDQLKRISLEQARSHPWVIKDLDDPEKWAKQSDPIQYPKLEVTEEEVKHAVTLKDKIRKHLRKLSETFIKAFSKNQSIQSS